MAENKSNELQINRIFNAPIQAVWDAWTDAKQVEQWWGPRGFTLTTHSKDLKPGGIWHYTMHGPDGTDYVNKTLYHEVEIGKKLVYDHGGNDERAPLFKVTVQFSELGRDKTQMEMTMAFPTPEAAQESKRFIKKAGGEGTWDRLAEYLEKKVAGKERFVINRSFEAPIEALYAMWTDPKHFANWIPPTGFRLEFLEADIRPGGKTMSVMQNDAGMKMYGRADYLELVKPERIVYTQQFVDENGKVSRHPMAPLWPETMLTTIQLTSEGPNRTRVTMTWEPYGPVKPEELAVFIQSRGGMAQGWTGSFDQLEAYLAKR